MSDFDQIDITKNIKLFEEKLSRLIDEFQQATNSRIKDISVNRIYDSSPLGIHVYVDRKDK